MSSYIMKTWIQHEFGKVVKVFGGSDKVERNEDNSISGEELVNEQNRRAAEGIERKAQQAKISKEREEARQKIRDKYDIKKKDNPSTTTKNQQQGKIENLIARIENANVKIEKINGPEPQGFDPLQMMTDAFNGLMRKFGWK